MYMDQTAIELLVNTPDTNTKHKVNCDSHIDSSEEFIQLRANTQVDGVVGCKWFCFIFTLTSSVDHSFWLPQTKYISPVYFERKLRTFNVDKTVMKLF